MHQVIIFLFVKRALVFVEILFISFVSHQMGLNFEQFKFQYKFKFYIDLSSCLY